MELPKRKSKREAEFQNKANDLKGLGMKIIIPFKKIELYTKLEVLLGFKLSRHTDSLTEASNLID